MIGLAGALLLAWALVEVRDGLRVVRWPSEKAHVVQCYRAHPFGERADSVEVRVVVVRPDGTDSYARIHVFDEHVHYFHELVYDVDGVPYAAHLGARRPLGDGVALYADPENPHRYRAEVPHFGRWALLAGVGAILIWAWLAL